MVKRPILRHPAKFSDDRSDRCWGITIYVILKMVAAAIMDFQKIKILTVIPLCGAEVRSKYIYGQRSWPRMTASGYNWHRKENVAPPGEWSAGVSYTQQAYA